MGEADLVALSSNWAFLRLHNFHARPYAQQLLSAVAIRPHLARGYDGMDERLHVRQMEAMKTFRELQDSSCVENLIESTIKLHIRTGTQRVLELYREEGVL